jgi:hypothetical protein
VWGKPKLTVLQRRELNPIEQDDRKKGIDSHEEREHGMIRGNKVAGKRNKKANQSRKRD